MKDDVFEPTGKVRCAYIVPRKLIGMFQRTHTKKQDASCLDADVGREIGGPSVQESIAEDQASGETKEHTIPDVAPTVVLVIPPNEIQFEPFGRIKC